jgi:DNA primase
MVKIPEHVVDEIRARARVSQVIERIGNRAIKRKGREFVTECPFHADRKPSLTINDAKGIYKCFPCSASGDALKFVMDYSGVGFLDAVAMVGELVGIHVDLDAPAPSMSDAERAQLQAQRERRHGAERILRAIHAAAETKQIVAAARKLWLEAQDGHDLALGYLRNRGIDLRALPRSMRAHRSLFHAPSELRWPGIVGVLEGPHGFAGVHRTYITNDGAKAPVSPAKMTLGPLFEAGACLRLQGARTRVALAEGIESALSAAQAIHRERQRCIKEGLETRAGELAWPVWSVLALEGFRSVVLPPEIREVMILPDADESTEERDGRRSGRDAAREVIDQAVARFQAEGRTVYLFDTPEGQDLNDMLLEGLDL